MPAELRKRKVAVLGARSVGKSSLIMQWAEGCFLDSYYPTIENSVSKSLNLKGVQYDCEVIDTAGQDEYSIFNSRHAVGIHGYVLVYSVASRTSFDMIQVLYDKIVDFCGVSQIPCVIVGSKVDLPARQVPTEEGQQLAKENSAAWIETSAKQNVNVGKVFELCLAQVDKQTSGKQTEAPAKGCTLM
ncbi:hypothetical protein CYLTODRAFT_434114 [Cylindrobasidium torrendii FP15055 ss-10]|uniref:Rheb small monomeric GTPase RhbA n=1 Tax=Cylindrobasidium torrendii FP15055 ss-10 TaxID=1314674 RepID=A0A0D7BTC5_9AGAR|nr:hypothetical protein CYLTODRAFT_434114 [Cylindrobasidium torrendii FP15055 ss-10]